MRGQALFVLIVHVRQYKDVCTPNGMTKMLFSLSSRISASRETWHKDDSESSELITVSKAAHYVLTLSKEEPTSLSLQVCSNLGNNTKI